MNDYNTETAIDIYEIGVRMFSALDETPNTLHVYHQHDTSFINCTMGIHV